MNLQKLTTHANKLKRIFERTLALIDEYKPDELAVEAPFFGKNVQSMLKLGSAQGVAIAAALYRDIPIYEYAPKKIKMAITGKGNIKASRVSAKTVGDLTIDLIHDIDQGVINNIDSKVKEWQSKSSYDGNYFEWKAKK